MRRNGLHLENFPQIVGVLNTQTVAMKRFSAKNRYTLQQAPQEMECPYIFLHNAGSDANYTLRALLLIVVAVSRYYRTKFDPRSYPKTVV